MAGQIDILKELGLPKQRIAQIVNTVNRAPVKPFPEQVSMSALDTSS